MAEMFSDIPARPVHILDPGAGIGTLSAAVCDRVKQLKEPRHLIFELWENDPRLEPHLCRTMEFAQEQLRSSGHTMDFQVRNGDFVLEHAQPSLLNFGSKPSFDFVIVNPPYFKVRKNSDHARAMAHVVHGQPNIYAFFLAVAADLLLDGGEMAAITPRSYFNGPYFRRFRKWFFRRMAVNRVHIFTSRDQAFFEDSVLQENVILLARKGGTSKDVVFTCSNGRQLDGLQKQSVPYGSAIDDANGDCIIRLTTNSLERRILAAVDRLPHKLRDFDVEISTGPVVAFRATKFLCHSPNDNTAPLLWMHNVRPFVTRFPSKTNGKPTHILINDESQRLLVPAKRYILLKRFTAKEERKRLVAAIMEPSDSYSHVVGLENHLNYIYRPEGELSKEEALGLASLLNSAIMDRYFRAISGNTQVNASEIRAMPLPSMEVIRNIGVNAERAQGDFEAIELIVAEAIGLPRNLIKQNCEPT